MWTVEEKSAIDLRQSCTPEQASSGPSAAGLVLIVGLLASGCSTDVTWYKVSRHGSGEVIEPGPFRTADENPRRVERRRIETRIQGINEEMAAKRRAIRRLELEVDMLEEALDDIGD